MSAKRPQADAWAISQLCRGSAKRRPAGRLAQLVEQCLGVFQNGRIEALCEPAIDWGEEIAGRITLALLAPEPGETDRGAQLPELRTLLLRNADGLAKAALGSGGVVTGAQQLPPNPVQLGL